MIYIIFASLVVAFELFDNFELQIYKNCVFYLLVYLVTFY
jgi:hypothetical protein